MRVLWETEVNILCYFGLHKYVSASIPKHYAMECCRCENTMKARKPNIRVLVPGVWICERPVDDFFIWSTGEDPYDAYFQYILREPGQLLALS